MSRPMIKAVASKRSPWQVFRAIMQVSPPPEVAFFLDSHHARKPDQNYSYIALNPFMQVRLDQPPEQGGTMRLVSGGRTRRWKGDKIFPALRRLLKENKIPKDPDRPFFAGGAIGLFGYEAVSLFERIHFRRKPHPETPLIYFGFFREVIVYDHHQKRYFLTASARTEKQAAARIEALEELLKARCQRARQDFTVRRFRADLSRGRFKQMVKKAKSYIAAGDIYQANLSQRFSFDYEGSPLRLYGKLRRINPSPFSSYIKIGELEVISSSPERLVSKRGNLCETRPIAGTRPLLKKERRYHERRRELLGNAKEQAEHIMLVDLERNDLGRVCAWDSVKVEELMKIERYSHVIHIVSRITGRLAEAADGVDLVQAMFPGGTITGCPKIRCMEIIDELEPEGRGLYTGSIGYFDFNGDLDMNIIIRTLVLKAGRGHLQVGAGIVYDSDPAREYEETLHKGKAMIEALAEAGALQKKSLLA